MTLSAHVSQLNAVLLPILDSRIELLGEAESGAFAYYVDRANRRAILGDYEVKIAQRCLDDADLPRSLCEIGAGFGQLVFLLALAGFTATGIEVHAGRHATGKLMLDALRAHHPALDARCALIHGGFPLASPTSDPRGTVLLTTNLVFGTPVEQQDIIVEAMRAYHSAIVDIDRLFVKRMLDADREQVFALFARHGFDSPAPFLDLGDDGRYFQFTPR